MEPLTCKLNTDDRTRVLILAVQVPFSRGGAEVLVDGLYETLKRRGYLVDVIQLPFSGYPNERLLAEIEQWRRLDVRQFGGSPIDVVIPTKFPSYMVQHPEKRIWLVHQFRQMYDLQGTVFADFGGSVEDEAMRLIAMQAEEAAFQEASLVTTISQNVSRRLSAFLEIASTPLYPPIPLGERYRDNHAATHEDYFLCVGRVCAVKRPDLAIRGLPFGPGKVKIVGPPDESVFDNYIRSEVDKHQLWNRVEFLGRVEDEKLIELYSQARAVVYCPFDEDYGYVTLEALASGTPVITCRDSGGVLEFVQDGKNGLVCDPTPQALGECYRRMSEDEALYSALRTGATQSDLPRSWDIVVDTLMKGFSPQKAFASHESLPEA